MGRSGPLRCVLGSEGGSIVTREQKRRSNPHKTRAKIRYSDFAFCVMHC